MYQNRLFNRTRIQLTSFYAVVIGLITLMSGYAIHVVMMQVFDRTINRELNTLSGTVHDTLEGILKQPEIVDPVVMKVLPGLCTTYRASSSPSSAMTLCRLGSATCPPCLGLHVPASGTHRICHVR